MRALLKGALCMTLALMCSFICIGYATISGSLAIGATINIDPLPHVYITKVTPKTEAGITVKGTSGTLLTATVEGAGTATLTVTVKNISDKIYVFDRVIDGAEANLEGVYSGTEITYELLDLAPLDEVAPEGGTLTFRVRITVPEGVLAEHYALKFNFIEKTGIPGEEYFPDDMPDREISLAERLSDVLNNRYTTETVTDARDYLINHTIKVTSWKGLPYVGSMDTLYKPQINELFGDILKTNEVAFILKNEDLNNDGYSEIAMYSTSDTLDSHSKDAGDGVVCVYVTVFTPVLDDNFKIIGYNMVCEALRGYCGEVRYSEEDDTPSFSTDTWCNDIGYWAWDDVLNKSYIEKVPDDAWSNDWTKPFREDFASYNYCYMYDFWRTAPWGKTIEECLDGKIPMLRWQ